MRYTSAVVLSTLAVGQAAASQHAHRHASFHARREAAASKRGDYNNVAWNDVAYDLKNVDWEKVDWSSVFAPAPAAEPTPTPAEEKPAPPVEATPTPEPEKETPPPPPPSKPTEKPAEAPKPKPAAPSEKGGSYGDKPSGDNFVGDLMAGVASVSEAIGAKIGINSKAPDAGLWIGGDAPNGFDVTNDGEDAVFYCWVKDGFSGMSLNAVAPAISVGIKKGQTVQINAAPGVSGACAPATTKTPKSIFGGVKNTWFEWTTPDSAKKSMGAFNISRNVNMKGCSISAKGKSCKSDMNTCVFECQDKNADSCEFGYELRNCDAQNGGGQGYDPIMAGVGGGCTMPDSGERLKVAFST